MITGTSNLGMWVSTTLGSALLISRGVAVVMGVGAAGRPDARCGDARGVGAAASKATCPTSSTRTGSCAPSTACLTACERSLPI